MANQGLGAQLKSELQRSATLMLAVLVIASLANRNVDHVPIQGDDWQTILVVVPAVLLRVGKAVVR